MRLFNKLFGNQAKTNNPDNTKLLGLLDLYWKEDGGGDTYKNVMLELINGNSFLMFPTQNDNTDPDKWTTTEKETTLTGLMRMKNKNINVFQYLFVGDDTNKGRVKINR